MEFNRKLQAEIARNRYSQAQLARQLGVSQALVSNWVQGKAIPDMREGLALSRLFGVPLEFLADDAMDEVPGFYSAEERALIGTFRGSAFSLEEATERLNPDTVIASRRKRSPR